MKDKLVGLILDHFYVFSEQNRMQISRNPICLSLLNISAFFPLFCNEWRACLPNRPCCIICMCILSRIECKKGEMRYAFLSINISAYLLPFLMKDKHVGLIVLFTCVFWAEYKKIEIRYVYYKQYKMQKSWNLKFQFYTTIFGHLPPICNVSLLG